jgi:hypothetical protein
MIDRRVAEKDKEYVKGCIRETESSPRQAKRTYDGDGDKFLESIWCRYSLLVFLSDRLGYGKSTTFAW